MRALGSVVAVGCVLAVSAARADSNDLTLEHLVGPPAMAGQVVDLVGNIPLQSQYKSLMSELGVVMSPRFLAPADTLGYSGFQFSVEPSFTAISNGAAFWKKGVENVSSSFLPTLSLMARKGLWLPLPAFELGVGATHLFGSSLYALQAYGKLGLHEGFHRWPIPSLAIRAAVSHVTGTPQVDLTVVSVDASVSKSFGIVGTVKVDPYLGVNPLFGIVRGQIIDTTPSVDAYRMGPNAPDLNANAVFPDPPTIVRWRLFGGLRLVYAVAALTVEAAYTLCNDTGGNCGQDNPTRVTDLSGGQFQLSISGSVIF